ncbi:MAG TPA: GGDEF domain-containing protein [Steroidobacteraceae bacterium]|jgi:diguanylate cyclase (GGDEF)-like protein
MTILFENVQVLALLIQAMGAALIGLLCQMLKPVVRHPALSAWVRGWLCLAGALIALLTEQALPTTAAVTLPLYMFGEYLFGYWIIEGCAHFGGRHWSAQWLPRLLVPLALFAAAAPQLIGYEFRAVFMVQSLALAFIFTAALVALSSAARREPASSGLLVMRVALLLLALIFLAYLPIFGSNLLWNHPLPLTLLKLSSATHLVLEFLLGFSGAVVVLEQSHHGLAVRNNMLTADNAKFRVQAERDALTGAYNRHAFFQLLDGLRLAATPVRGCAAMIDVDGLKQLNDHFGHVLGDTALIRVASAVQQLARSEDRLFRWGGDEFLLVALDQTAAAVVAQLDRLNAALAVPDAVTVQVSHGAVDFDTLDELSDAVKRADMQMYTRKRERAGLVRHARVERPEVAAALPLAQDGEPVQQG